MVCFPVMISMNLKTHTNTTRKHLLIEEKKIGGGDFTTGGEIFKLAILRVNYDYSFWNMSWKFFSCRLQL